MLTVIGLLLLPLTIIAVQIATGATGGLANGIYKLAFLIPPLIYCRIHGIRIGRDVMRWQHWRNDLGLFVLEVRVPQDGLDWRDPASLPAVENRPCQAEVPSLPP